MLPAPKTAVERQKHEEFYKKKIKEAFAIIDPDAKGYVKNTEISYIMRYLLQFPSEA